MGNRKIYRVEIDPEQCKGCERCVNACPRNVLKMAEKLNLMSMPYACYLGKGCIGCGGCFYTCPEPGAITVYETEGEEA